MIVKGTARNAAFFKNCICGCIVAAVYKKQFLRGIENLVFSYIRNLYNAHSPPLMYSRPFFALLDRLSVYQEEINGLYNKSQVENLFFNEKL